MASKIKNIELLKNVFGDTSDYILKKLESEKINISQRSSNFTLRLANLICNYVDFVYNGYFTSIDGKSMPDIESEYNQWFEQQRKGSTVYQNSEDGKNIFDYRKNNMGFYWVDLETHFSSEMMFKMNNCGGVGVNRRLIVLKENTEKNENLMLVVIVMDRSNFIYQIKGVENTKPLNFYTQIFDFFLNYNPILGFKGFFNKIDDFSLNDLTLVDKEKLKKLKPHLFNTLI